MDRSWRYRRALFALLRSQPGLATARFDVHDASQCLGYALRALLDRPRLGPAVFERVYSLVEPVIPFASLDFGWKRSEAR